MDILQRMAASGIVPVVVLDDAKDAVETARALLAGGIDVMEITFRTAAAPESIRNVSQACPDMLVGAGTVITLEQCKKAVDMGASFIVSPGFNAEIVQWCMDNGIAVTPGCVTPTEIMAAMNMGLKVLKFFPAGIYGGLPALKALSGPFPGIRFIPTGGVNEQNLQDFISAPFVHAVGGSWICPKAEISSGDFEKITKLCAASRKKLLGYEVAHLGMNAADADEARALAELFGKMFDFAGKEGNSSVFSSDAIEIMKKPHLGRHGHLAVRTNKIEAAVEDLKRKGYSVVLETAKYKGEKMTAVYLEGECGGFAIHLLQK